ncbi:unnamed protein product [Arctogadus glacialis]
MANPRALSMPGDFFTKQGRATPTSQCCDFFYASDNDHHRSALIQLFRREMLNLLTRGLDQLISTEMAGRRGYLAPSARCDVETLGNER